MATKTIHLDFYGFPDNFDRTGKIVVQVESIALEESDEAKGQLRADLSAQVQNGDRVDLVVGSTAPVGELNLIAHMVTEITGTPPLVHQQGEGYIPAHTFILTRVDGAAPPGA